MKQIPDDCRLYFRDIFDHFTRVDEHAEDYMDAVTSLVDAYLTVQSNRMNDTVKRLTLMSTVLLPLNFIASFYGMNFKGMPELELAVGPGPRGRRDGGAGPSNLGMVQAQEVGVSALTGERGRAPTTRATAAAGTGAARRTPGW